MVKKPKGTRDIINNPYWAYFEDVFKSVCENYNYENIRTPIFENSELFHRSLGETTDIIAKETYDFKDRKGRLITLRPELTAGIVRSYIENKIYAKANQPHKFYAFGTAYRYERPQAGRFREFTQAGVEIFGSDNPMIDAEMISVAYNTLSFCGLENVVIHLNSLGNNETRTIYKDTLIKHLKKYEKELCADCKKRISTNPLRVLDCKTDMEHEALVNAPSIIDHLDDDELARYTAVKLYLTILDISYIEDPKLVRGLDYYTSIVFELKIDEPSLGNQNALGGGGRYDNLIESLEGSKTSACGFSYGVDRIIHVMETIDVDIPLNTDLDAYVIAIDDNSSSYALSIANALRMSGFRTDIATDHKNLTKALKSLKNINPSYIIMIGEEELRTGKVKIKENATGTEHSIDGNDLITWLDKNIKTKE